MIHRRGFIPVCTGMGSAALSSFPRRATPLGADGASGFSFDIEFSMDIYRVLLLSRYHVVRQSH